MKYITLEDIHRQLRLEPDFTEDDDLLEGLGDADESFMEAHLNRALDDVAADNSGELPKALWQALLMMVDYSYDESGSGESRPVPDAYWILCKPWQNYTIV